MTLYEIAPGTSVADAMLRALPAEHARHVPASASGRYRILFVVKGDGGGTFAITVNGASLVVHEAKPPTQDIWVMTDVPTFRWALDDVAGRELLTGAGEVTIGTDPRLLARLVMLDGRLVGRLTGTGAAPGGSWIALGCGRRGASEVNEFEPDAEAEIPFASARAALTGTLRFEEVLGSRDVQLRGRRLLWAQLGMAMAVMLPKREDTR